MEKTQNERTVLFVTKATPEDNEFTEWLAPRLEAAGYQVFADILNLEGGERWRKTLTRTLQDRAVKQLLICAGDGLHKNGVQEEIGSAADVSRTTGDEKFTIPLRVRSFRKVFGMGELQYLNFEDSYADGLADLLETLEKQNVPKLNEPLIQPQWEQHRRRNEIRLENRAETLTSNWVAIENAPDEIAYVAPTGPCDRDKLKRRANSFAFPTYPHLSGFITFASPLEMAEHFEGFGPIKTIATSRLSSFMEKGWSELDIKSREAKNILVALFRQAWERRLSSIGFQEYGWASGLGHHAAPAQIRINERVAWGPKEGKRRSVLRNVAKGRVWSYGVSAIPNLYPFPHFRLKARVLFSDIKENAKGDEDRQGSIIDDKERQHRHRRSDCKGWRNKSWHGRMMAFLELVAGGDSYISLPIGAGGNLVLNVMPIQMISPVTTPIVHDDEDAEETDPSTLAGDFDPEDGDTSDEEEAQK